MIRSNLIRYDLLGFSLVLVMLSSISALAWENEISRDLAPVSGIVLASESEKEILVDMGSSKGLMVGDLLSIEEEGKDIFHPVTGKLLAKARHIVSLLRVTKVRTDYSHAIVIDGEEQVPPGEKVTRFSGLSAFFIDRVGNGRSLYSAMNKALPNLHWQGYRYIPKQEAAGNFSETDLVFILNNGLLQLKGQDQGLIRSYSITAKDLPTATVGKSDSSLKKQTVTEADNLLQDPQEDQAQQSLQWEKSASRQSKAIHFDDRFPGFDLLATVDGKILMADFYQQEGGMLIATTDGHQIRVFRFSDKLVPVAQYKSPALERIHSIQWWLPGENDELLLAVTASHSGDSRVTSTEELTPSSFILKFHNDRFILREKNLNVFLGTFDRDGDGRPETLLGQYFDIDRFFSSVKRLEFKGDKLQEYPLPAHLKTRLPVTQSVLADLTGNGQAESISVRNGMLRIYQQENLLHSIDENAGGSLSVVTYDKNPGQIDSLFETVSFEVPPIAADVDNDSISELLTITSEKKGFFSFGSNPDIEYSRIEILKYRDGQFLKGILPKLSGVSVQGLSADNKQIFVVAVSQEAEEDKPVSYLLAHPFANQE